MDHAPVIYFAASHACVYPYYGFYQISNCTCYRMSPIRTTQRTQEYATQSKRDVARAMELSSRFFFI